LKRVISFFGQGVVKSKTKIKLKQAMTQNSCLIVERKQSKTNDQLLSEEPHINYLTKEANYINYLNPKANYIHV